MCMKYTFIKYDLSILKQNDTYVRKIMRENYDTSTEVWMQSLLMLYTLSRIRSKLHAKKIC